jgi:predicted type IV restriction endonuclease
MDFIDEVKQFSAKTQEIKSQIQTEEATKHSLILPFIQLLGYNIFNPNEVVPEFTADIGIKKGEKVDYAILIDGKPSILIEAKNIDDSLRTHDSQLFRYFTTTESKFAILTNGLLYKFFSDIQEPNKMDETPFLEFNLLDIKDSIVAELKKFTKEVYNVEELFSAATTLKYTNKIKSIFDEELKDPKDEFIRYFIREIYEGKATQNVVERFKPIVKKALNQYISELMNDKIKAAIETTISSENEAAPATEELPTEEGGKKVIITTAMELEAFYLVKSICREIVDPKRISYKDTVSYFGILLDNNSRKWICRLFLDGSKKHIIYPKGDKEVKMPIDTLDDIFKYKDDLLEIIKQSIAIKD